MPVVVASRPTRVQPNHVYTAAPGYNLALLDGQLRPMPASEHGARNLPVDYFFRSLSQAQEEFAIGIVLSGTGSDGSLGLKEIKARMGLTLVQDEASAEYDGMPRSAIATGLVDYVLPIARMPIQLHTYAERLGAGQASRGTETPELSEDLGRALVVIRDRTGHDFSNYKRSTINRRIERRVNVHQIETMQRYVQFLESNPAEVDLLFRELLIGVTSFFRDPEAWDRLGGTLSELLKSKSDSYVFRAWVPGCSSGEEAYSLAILLRECMDQLGRTVTVQVFATDLDETSIDRAREGAYPVGIANDLTPDRLSRFFTIDGDRYRITKEIREMLVFAPQNFIADPPFTNLDLLSCRNLLIYLDATLQRRLLPVFHYSLRPQGVLFLGSSESVGSSADLFSPIHKRWKIFRRREVPVGSYVAKFPAASTLITHPARPVMWRVPGGSGTTLERTTQTMLLNDLVPPTVLVRERGELVFVHGRTGDFLEPAPGSQTAANVFNMIRPGLHLALPSAIRKAALSGVEVVQRGRRLDDEGNPVSFSVRVVQIKEPETLKGLFRITFESGPPVVIPGPGGDDAAGPGDRIEELERELGYTKESHQGTIEELETANEELKSTNEELQSTNEELQSANEELETSKEEMQSLNEELQTVNSELQEKVEELSRANNDMKNLLNGTDIATVFLDNALHIKRFTEQAKRVLPLIPSDIGRHIGDLASTIHYDRLVADANDVLRTLVFRETEVRGEDGAHYLLRILPYRTTENVIDGLVLTFIDITSFGELQARQDQLLAVVRDSRVSFFCYDLDLRITWASSPAFGGISSALAGRSDEDVFRGEDVERFIELKKGVIASRANAHARLRLGFGAGETTHDVFVEPNIDQDEALVGLTCVAIQGRQDREE